jgi:stage V sporulation protein B
MSKYKQTFIQGTMILLVAGMINRILGFVPRIALPRVIGAEGVGLYQMGYPFLILLVTFITGGIPLAIAKLVAESESAGDEARVRAILRISLTLTVSIGTILTILCFLLAPWLTRILFTDDRIFPTFLFIGPVLLVISVSAVYRGYFQGRQNMIPPASSSVVETLARIVGMLGLSYWLLPYGIEYAAAGAMAGVLVGEICGCLVLLFDYWRSKKNDRLRNKVVIEPVAPSNKSLSPLKRLLRVSIPVTAARLVGSASYFLESIFIIHSLSVAGIAISQATAQYGALQGMIIPILLLPSALTYSLSTSLVPSLSEAAAKNDMATIQNRLHISIKLAILTGAPFSVLMYVLAQPICLYLYKDPNIGVMLKMMAPFAIFIYIQAPLTAALQALDRPGAALINTAIGSVIKLALIVGMATQPKFGILGAIFAINLNIMIVTLLHWRSVARLLKFRLPGDEWGKIILAMFLMGASVWIMSNSEGGDNALLRFLGSIILGMVVYGIALIWLKLVDREDLNRLVGFWKRM